MTYVDLPPIAELLAKQEPLLPELEDHVVDSVLGGMVHHPLIVDYLFGGHNNALMNARLKAKQAAADQALEAHEWARFIGLHERPYRVEAFQEAASHGLEADPKTYWSLLSWVWTDQEFLYSQRRAWRTLWGSDIPGRKYVMTRAERTALARMPQDIKVWRGTDTPNGVEGLSWTTDRDKAAWFSRRWIERGQQPIVVSGQVQKTNVLAYLEGRGESEIIVLPENVTGKRRRYG